MIKKLLLFLVLLIIFLTSENNVFAISDPLSVPNNKFGIHIFDEKDLPDAAKLVNTNGDWGYVTLVIREDERDTSRWQKVFDQMRRLHLIPIVRIATIQDGGNWKAPKEEEIDKWVDFLNSLNWVVKNRYIVVANEPNHANEWGGLIYPEQYAVYLKSFSQRLKSVNDDYFILPAGLDASATNQVKTMEESVFLRRMLKAEPDIFKFIDGWNSHSYPNPAFAGKETASGKGTIKSYEWELEFLKSLGVTKDLPVFITETGWSQEKLLEEDIANKYIYAYTNVWNDKRVVAVTPFILNYMAPPFNHFSWKKEDGTFHSSYQKISELPKVKGIPNQIVKGKILGIFVNPVEIAGDSVSGVLLAQNLGQSIWIEKEVEIGDQTQTIAISTNSFESIEPLTFKLMYFKFKAPEKSDIYNIPFVVSSNGVSISDKFNVEISVEEVPVTANKVKKLGFFDTMVLKFKGAIKLIEAKFSGN